jgi:hypothetical protein
VAPTVWGNQRGAIPTKRAYGVEQEFHPWSLDRYAPDSQPAGHASRRSACLELKALPGGVGRLPGRKSDEAAKELAAAKSSLNRAWSGMQSSLLRGNMALRTLPNK